MPIDASYTPPPKVCGTVTLKLDETTAQKLRALLDCCTGDHFDDLFHALDILPEAGRLKLKLGRAPESQEPYADGSPRCISLGGSYGAKFLGRFD